LAKKLYLQTKPKLYIAHFAQIKILFWQKDCQNHRIAHKFT